MLATLIGNIEEAKISFSQAVFGFIGIVCVRFFLENLSSPIPGSPAVPDMLTMVHYGLFYAGAALSTVLALRIFVPDIKKISKVVLALLPIMWFPPLIDLILSNGLGSPMAYIFAGANALWINFITLGGTPLFGGITLGIKMEMVVILAGLAFYVFLKTKSIMRSVAIVVIGYCVVFVWLAFPSIIAFFWNVAGDQLAAMPAYFILGQFGASHILTRLVPPGQILSYLGATGTLFNAGISYLYYLLDLALMVGWALAYRPHFLKEFLRNCRPERVTSFLLLIGVGIFVSMKVTGGQPFGDWVDVVALVVLAIAYFCAWIFAVGVNDIVDIDIDRVSNQGRPLITSKITEEEMRSASLFFLLWSFVGALLVGYWALFAMMLFTAAYYVYSAPPLRLKRVPMIATFLIALASLSAAAAGFYFANTVQLASAFPGRLIVFALVFFTLITNVKDIKDVEGDRAAGIATIPTIFKGHSGRAIIGAMVAVAFLSVPVIVSAPALFVPSLIAAALGYYFVVAEPYHERRIFLVYFLFAAVAGVMFLR